MACSLSRSQRKYCTKEWNLDKIFFAVHLIQMVRGHQLVRQFDLKKGGILWIELGTSLLGARIIPLDQMTFGELKWTQLLVFECRGARCMVLFLPIRAAFWDPSNVRTQLVDTTKKSSYIGLTRSHHRRCIIDRAAGISICTIDRWCISICNISVFIFKYCTIPFHPLSVCPSL
jgi:hypothetical protein